ncbi:MAG: hypothetical protein WBQ94_27830 [Terracidiphilus sp.]
MVGQFILAPMALKDIVTQIDEEIARLQQARSLLTAAGIAVALHPAGRGRPKKNAGTRAPSKPAKKKRNLSPEGRARIAEAVKRRWAAQKATSKQNGKA